MLDLAAIVAADPPALLAWVVLAFAAGMYPVGIMLGSSCSPCCCGCPELCGYYVESRAGAFSAYPREASSGGRVQENAVFCSLSQYLNYNTIPALQVEQEGTVALPSKCGFDADNVQYSATSQIASNSIWARVTAKLAVPPEANQAEPVAQARVDLTCNNGDWTVETLFTVVRHVNGQMLQCSATKTFSIDSECSLDGQGCQATSRLGKNIDGLIITVSGTGVSLPTLGRTIAYTSEDRDDDCMTDGCLEAWRSMWQATFEIHRVPCTPPKCTLCEQGELPETLTVTFSGLADRTPGPDLCALTFSAPYGSGAAGKVTAPGGDPATDKGPISSVSLTNGGSGYAKLGRVAPTITASGGSGTGATFTVNKTSSNDANGIPSWGVTGVTWTGSTSGYVDGDQITFGVAAGDTAEQGAAATIHTVRTAPTVTASVSGGSGATLSVTTATNGTTPQTWSVTGVTVTNGGTGYPASGYVTFNTASCDTAEQSADATFYSGRVAPTVTASASGSGSGAVVSASLSSTTGYDGRTYWYVTGISVTNGGTGYAEYDPVAVTVTDGEGYGAYAEVSAVDGSGAITGIAVYWGGEYFKSNGIIQSVEFGYGGGGIYYRDAGEISSISVEAGGTYYREDASLSPYVATVTVGVSQTAPSNGTGATLTATVESSTSSANFGKITGVTIGSGGNNYLAWQWRNTKCCGDFYNGLSVVLKRQQNNPCFYEHSMCGVGNISRVPGRVVLSYNGPSSPPSIGLFSEWLPGESSQFSSSICNTSFTASGNVTNCSDWSGVSFSASGSATASVTVGGTYDATFKNPGGGACHICCKGDEPRPAEIEADVQIEDRGPNAPGVILDRPGINLSHNSGTYVLTRNVDGYSGSFPWTRAEGTNTVAYNVNISVVYELCASQTSSSFSEDYWGCDDCHKKCRVVASVYGGGSYDRFLHWYDSRRCVTGDGQQATDQCSICEQTPICDFTGKSFSLCVEKSIPWFYVQQCGDPAANMTYFNSSGQNPANYDDGCGALTIDIS